MPSEMELTAEEKRAIVALKRLGKRWPKGLWLFSASGSLCVMKFDEDGERVKVDGGGMDPYYTVDTIAGIPNDGGDW